MGSEVDAVAPVTGFALDRASDTPPFAQLTARIRSAVQSGRLAPGTRLPTVRALAEQLGLAAGTVAKVYRELETDGVIETRGRAGTFVAASDPTHARAIEAAEAFAARMRDLGVTTDEALTLARRALSA